MVGRKLFSFLIPAPSFHSITYCVTHFNILYFYSSYFIHMSGGFRSQAWHCKHCPAITPAASSYNFLLGFLSSTASRSPPSDCCGSLRKLRSTLQLQSATLRLSTSFSDWHNGSSYHIIASRFAGHLCCIAAAGQRFFSFCPRKRGDLFSWQRRFSLLPKSGI